MSRRIYRQNKTSNKINNKGNQQGSKNINSNITAKQKQNYNKILKLNNKEQVKAIARVFSNIANIRNKKDYHTQLAKEYSKIAHLNTIFANHSKAVWSRVSKHDYGQGFHIPKNYIKNNEIDKKLIIKLINSKHTKLNIFNKTENYFPFIASDEQIKNLINMPKKIVAEQILKQHKADFGDSLIVRHLLSSTSKSGKTYLFLSDFITYHNQPQVTVSLNLLVNGHEKGLKPLARYDTIGHFSNNFLSQNNLQFNVDEIVEKTISNKITHENITKNNYEIKDINSKVTKFEHMHIATNLQDNIFAASLYLNDKLKLNMKLNTSLLSAINTDVYEELNYNKTLKQEVMVNDATSLNGYVPAKQIYNFIANYYNINTKRFTDNLFNLIDTARSNITSQNFPSVDTFYKKDYINVKPFVVEESKELDKVNSLETTL